MKISIIIPTYNRSVYILKTIDSFVHQNYPKDDYELIIADNNSTDNTRQVIEEYLKTARGLKITYIFEGRQGVHYARNTAARMATHDLLYFTDDDMIADLNLLNEIVKPFLFDEMVGTATGKVLPIWEVSPPKWILKYFSNQYLSLLDPPEEFLISKKINYLYSCHQAIQRAIFIKAEGFNPEFTEDRYVGDGESGLNAKIEELGYKFGYNSASLIHHIIPASRMTQKYINRRFANGAISHSYSEYRINRPSATRLIIGMLIRTCVFFPLKLLSIIFKSIRYLDKEILHFIPGYISYYYTRAKYEMEIILSARLRRFVLKSDWYTNDTIRF